MKYRNIDYLRGGWDHPFRKSPRGLENVIIRVVFWGGDGGNPPELDELGLRIARRVVDLGGGLKNPPEGFPKGGTLTHKGTVRSLGAFHFLME